MNFLRPFTESPRAASSLRRGAVLGVLVSAAFVAACSPDDPSTGAAGGAPSEAALKAPAAGDLIAIGTQQPIEWEPAAGVSAVDVTATLPDGSLRVIAKDAPNSGSLQWDVPLLPSADPGAYTISVQASGGTTASDWTAVGKSLAVGSVAGFKWNGATEDYYWVDLLTGESTVLGTVGDMKLWEWKGGSAFDAQKGLIYVVASPDDAASVWKIYTLDAATGALVNDAVITGEHPSSIQVNAAGTILGMRWNGAHEDVTTLDPTTGAVSVIGAVGNLSLWSTEAAIDNENNRLYVIGEEDPDFDPATGTSGPNAAWSVYTIDALTGALLDTKPLAEPEKNLAGLAVARGGDLVAFRWNGSAEELVAVDPASGAVTVRGVVGDLMLWSGYTALNPTTNVIYVFGNNPSDAKKLYTMSVETGALLYDIATTDYPSTALLVY